MRRTLTILVLIAIAAATAWTLFRWNKPTVALKDPWRAIPQQAAIIIEVPDALNAWSSFTGTSQIWNALEQVPGVLASGKLMSDLIAQLDSDEAFAKALQDVPILITIMRDGGERIGSLFILAPERGGKSAIATMARVLKADEAALASGSQVEVRPDTMLPALSVRFSNGLWVIASSSTMLDESEFQLTKGKSITTDSVLTRARKTLGAGADAHVLAHTGRVQALLNTMYVPATLEQIELPLGWIAMDLSVRPEALLLSGLFVAERPDAMMDAIQEQGSGLNTLSRELPSTVNWIDVIRIQDPMRYLSDRWKGELGESSSLTSLFGWVKGTATAACASGDPGQRWAILRTTDPVLASEALTGLCDGNCDTAAYRGVRLTKLPIADPYSTLLGSHFTFSMPWWIVLGDAVIFSDDPLSLRKSIDGWNDGNTFAEDERAIAWMQQIGGEAGRTMWCDIARSKPMLRDGLRDATAKGFTAYDTLWNSFGGVSVQLAPGLHGIQHIAIGLQYAPMEERGTQLLWSTLVGPLVSRTPDIVINHTNNTREVLVQGMDNRIHLVGSTGKLLWSQALDGAIMGKVHQVDRFRNGKLQLLFNTAEKIYLIDRNGKDVGGFPIPLKSNATAPLAVFDYDGKRDYRILVPTADRKILNYTLDGIPVTGWEPKKLDVASNDQLHHVRIKNKDFLIVAQGDGSIRIVDRRGDDREKSKLILTNVAQVDRVLPGLDIFSTRIIWTDTSGALMQGRLDGTTEQLAAGGQGHSSLGRLGDDGQFDIIHVVADSLIVTHANKEVLTKTFGETLLPGNYTYFGTGALSLYGAIVPTREQVHVIDDRGYPLEGVPLNGSIPFAIADLNHDGKDELITATKDGVIMVYQLQGQKK